MHVQQGDVIGRRVNGVPTGAREVEPVGGWHVIAEGEATGHAHRVKAEPGVGVFELDGKLYLSVDTPVEQTHEEHGTVTWEKGVYEIGRVRERDWLGDVVRTVAD